MNGLDLFSGIGGITLALREWVKPIGYIEIDPFCQAVLLSRMADESLPNSPIWGDIRTFDGLPYFRCIDIVYGGFPCQDISCAGNGAGLEGKRSGLFFEIVRLAKEIKPKFIFLENVPAITTRGGLQVVREITEMGYDCRWCVISAQSVGALHRRERWFLLAHTKHDGAFASEKWKGIGAFTDERRKLQQEKGFGKTERASSIYEYVANNSNTDSEPSKQTDTKTQSNTTKQDSRRGSSRQYWSLESREHWQETVSAMGKCSDGISNHVDRLKALGNSVVPEQARQAFKLLMGIK